MRALEIKGTVSSEGILTAQLPGDISSGEHDMVLVVDTKTEPMKERPSFDFPVHSCGPWPENPISEFPVISVGSWPENLSLRREDLYDDWGR